MRRPLSDKFVQSLKPSTDIYWDLYLPCFGVRRGKYRTSFVIYKDYKRKTIASYPQTSLAKARDLARAILLSDTSPLTLAELIEEYLRKHAHPNTKAASAREIERILRKYFMLDKHVSEITARTISPIIETLAPSTANQATLFIKAVFNWAVSQQYLALNPLQTLKKPYRMHARERVLSDTELRDIRRATRQNTQFNHIVQCLLLSGQRKSQFATLHWDQVSTDSITWTALQMKGNKPHTIPMPWQLVKIISDRMLHRAPEDGPYVFGSPNRSWSRPMEELRAKLPHIPHFTLHDIRRTVSTNMHRLGTPPHIVEHILAHAPPTIAATYNKWQYHEECKTALQNHADWVSKL